MAGVPAAVRNKAPAGDPFDRPRWLARRTGLDPVAAWERGVAERAAPLAGPLSALAGTRSGPLRP